MTEEHPNIAVIKQLDLRNSNEAPDLFAEGFVGQLVAEYLAAAEGGELMQFRVPAET